MSNQAVGSVYKAIIDEVVNSSRVDFEESGVEESVLEELRQVREAPFCHVVVLSDSYCFVLWHYLRRAGGRTKPSPSTKTSVDVSRLCFIPKYSHLPTWMEMLKKKNICLNAIHRPKESKRLKVAS